MCDASSITCVHPLTFFKYFQRPTSLFECVIFRSIPFPNRHKWYLLKCITNYRRTTKCNRFSLAITFDHFAVVFFSFDLLVQRYKQIEIDGASHSN